MLIALEYVFMYPLCGYCFAHGYIQRRPTAKSGLGSWWMTASDRCGVSPAVSDEMPRDTLTRWQSLTVPRAALPGLDACDVAKEPFVFYGAGPARFFFPWFRVAALIESISQLCLWSLHVAILATMLLLDASTTVVGITISNYIYI